VEQQGKTVDEINALWYDEDNTWGAVRREGVQVDELINEFNEATGLLKNL
jgi:cysteine synthase A